MAVNVRSGPGVYIGLPDLRNHRQSCAIVLLAASHYECERWLRDW